MKTRTLDIKPVSKISCKFYLAFVLLFSIVVQAETRTNFSFVESAYVYAGLVVPIVGEEFGAGYRLSASWQFSSKWFVFASSLNTNGHDEYTNDPIEANEQMLSIGYILTSTKKTDWYTRFGRVYREVPGDNVYPPYPQSSFTPMQAYYNNSLALGARHRLSQRVELSWFAETQDGGDSDGRAGLSLRFFATEALSFGYALELGDDLGELNLNARYQF